MHDIGMLLFELTLFIIFVYFLSIIFSEKVTPVLKEQIEEAKKHLVSLKKKKQLLETQHNTLQEQIQKQDKKLVGLEQKMKQWHDSIISKNEKIAHERELLKQKLIVKKERQMDRLANTLLKKAIVPQALEQTRSELTKNFSGSRGKSYMLSVIAKLQR